MASLPQEEWEWLTPKQREAVRAPSPTNLMVLPAAGPARPRHSKPCESLRQAVIALCAPTGRGAKECRNRSVVRLRRSTACCSTPPAEGFRVNRDNPLDVDVVIADEMSMACIEIADALLDAIDPEHTTLILVGDVNQLPSVGPGRVLNDVIASGVCPVINLTEILRQDEASAIITNAHAIHAGRDLVTDNVKEFFFAPTDDTGQIVEWIGKTLEVMPPRFGLDPVRDVQVLCPANVSSIGADALNPFLSRLLNPTGTAIKGSSLKVGDKVMQQKNNYKRLVSGRRAVDVPVESPRSEPEWTNAVSVDFIFNTGAADFARSTANGGVIESSSRCRSILVAFDDGVYSLYRVRSRRQLIRPLLSAFTNPRIGIPAVISRSHNQLPHVAAVVALHRVRGPRYLVLIALPTPADRHRQQQVASGSPTCGRCWQEVNRELRYDELKNTLDQMIRARPILSEGLPGQALSLMRQAKVIRFGREHVPIITRNPGAQPIGWQVIHPVFPCIHVEIDGGFICASKDILNMTLFAGKTDSGDEASEYALWNSFWK
jgi:hypothetical protein